MEADKITGIVLCGGRGSRMGGADKPLEPYLDQPMVEQVLERLAPQVGSCLISANRNLDRYQRLADACLPKLAPVLVLADQLTDYQGPLAGVHSALQACTTPWFFVCPGDAPRLPLDLLDRLSGFRNEAQPAVANDGERQQQLHFLGHRSLLSVLERYLQSGRRSVAGFHEACSATSVACGKPRDFASINRLTEG